MRLPESVLRQAMLQACDQARLFEGATSPNPIVGAAALDSFGKIIALRAHEKAGQAHAEASLLADLAAQGRLGEIHTLVVTLEPCNHFGKTPPCTHAILKAGITRVVYGTKDPNPSVDGGGAEYLAEEGIEVTRLELPECEAMNAPFAKRVTTGLPWVTLKTAFTPSGSMIPGAGEKTFTSKKSLVLAHELRKKSDAILTGIGTVLADRPLLTVRHVADHPGKSRWLVVMDRNGRLPLEWAKKREADGFKVMQAIELEPTLRILAAHGVNRVLVEAGPRLTSSVLSLGLWDEHYSITQISGSEEDQIEVFYRDVHGNYSKDRPDHRHPATS